MSDPTVTLVRTADEHPWQSGNAYDVYLSGVLIGAVFRSTRTLERKPRGLRYVTARGRTPCWRTAPNSGFPFDTRRAAVADLVRTAGTKETRP